MHELTLGAMGENIRKNSGGARQPSTTTVPTPNVSDGVSQEMFA